MGTRADFYVGRGPDAEWLGSIAWDGQEIDYIEDAMIEDSYRSKVQMFLESRDDATFPHMGWPWPWNDSHTSDCAYAFDEGKVWEVRGSKYDSPNTEHWAPRKDRCEEYDEDADRYNICPHASDLPVTFPDMKSIQNVNYGDRSGVIIVGM